MAKELEVSLAEENLHKKARKLFWYLNIKTISQLITCASYYDPNLPKINFRHKALYPDIRICDFISFTYEALRESREQKEVKELLFNLIILRKIIRIIESRL